MAAVLLGSVACDSFGIALARPLRGNFYPGTPRIAIIIDDIGSSRSATRRFLDIGAPLTFAVLPKLARTAELVEAIQSDGHEIMLHQPMEPLSSHHDPGPGALYTGDSAERIHSMVLENLSNVPYATGVNNHMGSRFTACGTEMNRTLEIIRDRHLFFVDSLTSSRSKAYDTALHLGVPAASRNVFLDNIPEVAAIKKQLIELRCLAGRRGTAIGIGHPHRATAKAVAWFAKQAPEAGFSLVYASNLVR